MRILKIANKVTNRESESFKHYLRDISNIEMLTPEEEVELAIKIQEGDEQAKHRLVNSNLKFVPEI